jgi:hypothetical protein
MSHIQAAEAVVDWEYDWDTIEVVDSEPVLDADPEPDSITPGFTLKPHRWGWAVCIHGEFHRSFRKFEAARAYLEAAERDWNTPPWTRPDEPRPSAFTGHPAQERGE